MSMVRLRLSRELEGWFDLRFIAVSNGGLDLQFNADRVGRYLVIGMMVSDMLIYGVGACRRKRNKKRTVVGEGRKSYPAVGTEQENIRQR